MLKFNDYLKECDYGKKMKKEELVGKQHKLDKNHNGKIDSQDLKIVRGEKAEESFKPEIADKFPASGVKTQEPKGKYPTMPKDKEKAKGTPANKMSEETELEEGRMKELSMDLKDMSDDEFHKHYGKPKHEMDPSHFKKPVQKGHEMERARALAQRGMMSVKEEAEIIAELSKKTLQSYQDKIGRDLDRAADAIGHGTGDDDEDRKLNNRMKGDERARAKLKKMKEEVEQVAEENHALAYVNATLAVMDEGKIDDLRDAQALRRANASAYDKNTKTDDKHPAIKLHKGTAYGGANQKDDEGDEKKDDETKEKRGRGRPHGSKSGARQKGNGHEDGGIPVHSLHLPNRNR